MNENNLSIKLAKVENTISEIKITLDLPEETTLEEIEANIVPEGERIIISEYGEHGSVKGLIFKNMETFPTNMFNFDPNITSYTGDPFEDLESITLSENFKTLPDKSWCFANSKLKYINLKDTQITTVPYYFFSTAENLEIEELPDTITSLSASSAFQGCKKLKLKSLPKDLTNIGEYVFMMCENLMLTELPPSLKTIGQRAFGYCKSLKALRAFGVTLLSNSVFESCTGLVQISLPKIVTINSGVFSNCSNLKAVWIGADINGISGNPFANANKLTNIYIDLPRATVETKSFHSGFSGKIICNDDEKFITQEEFNAID